METLAEQSKKLAAKHIADFYINVKHFIIKRFDYNLLIYDFRMIVQLGLEVDQQWPMS